MRPLYETGDDRRPKIIPAINKEQHDAAVANRGRNYTDTPIGHHSRGADQGGVGRVSFAPFTATTPLDAFVACRGIEYRGITSPSARFRFLNGKPPPTRGPSDAEWPEGTPL